jgi:hypothetical protein
MFDFLHRSPPRYPTIHEALTSAGVAAAAKPGVLTVIKQPGSYAGRRVSYFRAFDPTRAAAQAVRVHAFSDLDAHRDLVLGSGHVEREGLVMVNGAHAEEGPTPPRHRADRAVHADDERFVNRNAELALTAAARQADPDALPLP